MSAERTPYFVGFSTKMYFGRAQTLTWLERARRELDDRPELSDLAISPFIVPSFPMLVDAERILSGSPAIVGAQTVSWGDGALTGEVSATLLVELGVRIVEIGHAERRAYCDETDDVVRKKVKAAVDAGIRPLVCVGEEHPGAPRDAAAHCLSQIEAAGGPGIPGLVMAYEPVWAIGAAAPAPATRVNEVIAILRESVGAPIIYGGSAGPGLVGRIPQADGVFLGRLAHDPRAFGEVLDEAIAHRRSAGTLPEDDSSSAYHAL